MATFKHDHEELLAALVGEDYKSLDKIKKSHEKVIEVKNFDISKLPEDSFSTGLVNENMKYSIFSVAQKEGKVFAARCVKIFLFLTMKPY